MLLNRRRRSVYARQYCVNQLSRQACGRELFCTLLRHQDRQASLQGSFYAYASCPFWRFNGNRRRCFLRHGCRDVRLHPGHGYNHRRQSFLWYVQGEYVASSFAFWDETTRIGDCAFWDNGNTLHIAFPSAITYIGDSAFYGCGNMTFF